MGAGQAADAAPAGDDPLASAAAILQGVADTVAGMVASLDAAPAAPEVTHATFLALVMTAFDCKFPSHPKPSAAWWAEVRAAGQHLQGL
jgi:hypothetical protein